MWKLLRIIILLFLMIPVISWICWKFKDKVQMNLLVVDKTVPNGNYSEHLSFFWVANQKRWVKPNGEEYNFAEDFYGFHPGDDGRYVIKDLRIFEKQGLSALADSLDLAFFADTYGIYNSNWKDHPDYGKDTISLFYGGLQPAEFNLIREMKRKGKTIIAEFNFIAAPTSELVRNQTEQLLGLKWSGWVGKYYHTLDTVLDPEIPRWLPDLYKKNYKKEYDFKNAGIVLVDNKERIVILDAKKHLNRYFPILESELSTQLQYNVPESIYYPFWFDVNSTDSRNHVLAWFNLDVNEEGKALLDQFNLPKKFPAILEHDQDYRFIYFACDFSNNEMGIYSSYFNGINRLSGAFYNANQVKDRRMFFWKYYRPFMGTVMDSVSARKDRKVMYVD
ncbi:hypothetical protein GQR60_18365 [Labilibaculum sp. A4]|uniref:hypothetical protein n=1 Tax=Labilibaculum euxinus TaxID=2686357 RepID=UPI000F62775C|nr:hypothetical protein [Labilibaculum euxinus]MDQ1772741.1 hypothetical protein [Labilibaculum euxinus]MWN78301.1 hypothetical protein [Labilibaculum euxinus]